MSKIICDVCGTSYPETATQCPICGCVRSGNPVTVAGDTNEATIRPATSYTHVKGGRFSKANVKKRNAAKPVYNAEPMEKTKNKQKPGKKGEKGLIAVVIFLLLAIAAVVVYIALQVFDVKLPFGNSDPKENTTGTVTQSQQSTETVDTTVLQIPCVNLELSDTSVTFDKEGAVQLLNVKATPENHTDEIVYESSDSAVVTVDENGKLVAVGTGTAMVTVVCGDQTAQCDVVCNIPEETTETTVPEVTYSMDAFKLNSEDFSIPTSEKSYRLYSGEIPAELITFASEDESIATFVDGVVTVGQIGVTTVSATYQGVTLKCIVRVW